MSNHKFIVRYDGRDFFGWQRHKDRPTIQGAIENALAEVQGRKCLIHGSGRTDRGAHAEGQVFNADLDDGRDPSATRDALNAILAPRIEILAIDAVPEGFHARRSARGKVYRYEIWNAAELPPELFARVWHIPGALQRELMIEACAKLVGERDFATFATRSNYTPKSTRRDLRRVDLVHEGPKISLVLEADGFLYKMVRNIVRAIVKVGEGRTRPEAIPTMLEARDRKVAPGTAPASGLYLDSVWYD